MQYLTVENIDEVEQINFLTTFTTKLHFLIFTIEISENPNPTPFIALHPFITFAIVCVRVLVKFEISLTGFLALYKDY